MLHHNVPEYGRQHTYQLLSFLVQDDLRFYMIQEYVFNKQLPVNPGNL